MRTLGFWTLFSVAFVLLTCSNCMPDYSTRLASFGDVKAGLTNTKLKDMTATFNTATTKGDSNLEDYPGQDPSPSSKVDVHAGPIENGSPLMPYFIGPNPPPHRGQVSP
ncbi:hypothetical protein MA16_Dca012794 [Dendrobium catenatum]|uniref:Uncharacterized protein n=1 Tax=Dendrobium catenatum TaxID=906689 RepID=A0A2I0V7T2_9ASPA|nr:hypothetical protein MA16_Dca012794 [Dendrobium catenatum]